MSITFEPTISLGSIITGVMILVTVIGAAMRFSSRLTALEIKMDAVWKSWVRQGVTHGNIDDGCG